MFLAGNALGAVVSTALFWMGVNAVHAAPSARTTALFGLLMFVFDCAVGFATAGAT